MSRPKQHATPWLDFQPSNLQLTNQYYAKYEAISVILDETPEILDLLERDLRQAMRKARRGAGRRKRSFRYSVDNVLRILICQAIEGASLREIVVRIDDSWRLRFFARLGTGPMMDFTTLNRLCNAIQPETWKAVNKCLARAAIKEERIRGEALRLDTTAVEADIHFPTDSSLLWDAYRSLARLLKKARELDAAAVGARRLQLRCVKRLHMSPDAVSEGLGDTQIYAPR